MGSVLPTTHASSKNSRIVFQQSFLAQTGAMPSQTLLTATAEGDYRVSVYTPSHNPGGNSGLSVTTTISWTDNVTSRIFFTNPPSGNFCCVAQSYDEISIPIHVAAGASITVQANSNATDQYDVYVTIEEL